MTGQQQTIIDCTPGDGWDGIAAALARARPGERVRCAAGDYRGTTGLRVPGGVTLAGGPGTRLIWDGEGSAVWVEGVAGVVIEGIEVLGGEGARAETVPERSRDALILVSDCTGVRIADCAVSGGGEYLHGILVRRCSGVAIEDCRALHCRTGILINSSIDTTADRNLCGNNRRSGMGAGRDSEHPERPCHCRFTGNRSHDNQQAGISFASSSGHVEDNDCWGNAYGGIALYLDPETPDSPADADLIRNRSHDNQFYGIAFMSSHGRAEDNDCWGNASDGILVTRNLDTPDAPADAVVFGNRCHGNQEHGICFYSSQGRAEKNDCWGNASHGIALRLNTDIPDAPADADLIGNHCHDNRQSGILFSSSHGRADGNDCWGNTKDGIVLDRADESPNAPPNAHLIRNRCHDNQQDGILFFSSNGRCEANCCWNNRLGDTVGQVRQPRDPTQPYLGTLPPGSVQIDSHFTTPPDPATRRNRPLVEALTGLGIARPEPLADFLRSGCLDCFSRFWSGDSAARTASPEPTAPAQQESAPADPDAPRVYRFSQGPDGLVKLERRRDYGRVKASRLALPDADPAPPSEPALSATLAGFVTTWLKGSNQGWDLVYPEAHPADGDAKAPHRPGLAWNLALVSAAPASLDVWLGELEESARERLAAITRGWSRDRDAPDRPPRLADPLVVDLTGWSGGPGGLRAQVERALLLDSGRRIEQSRGDRTRPAGGDAAARDTEKRLAELGRRAERRREIWLLPAGWKLVLLLVPPPLALGLVWKLAGGAALTAFLGQGGGDWSALGQALWQAWSALGLWSQALWALTPVAALVAWVTALNLRLPRALHLRLPWAAPAAEAARENLLSDLVALPQ